MTVTGLSFRGDHNPLAVFSKTVVVEGLDIERCVPGPESA
jgi:hypothetical protein